MKNYVYTRLVYMNVHSSVFNNSQETNNPNVHQLMNGYRKSGISMQ